MNCCCFQDLQGQNSGGYAPVMRGDPERGNVSLKPTFCGETNAIEANVNKFREDELKENVRIISVLVFNRTAGPWMTTPTL